MQLERSAMSRADEQSRFVEAAIALAEERAREEFERLGASGARVFRAEGGAYGACGGASVSEETDLK